MAQLTIEFGIRHIPGGHVRFTIRDVLIDHDYELNSGDQIGFDLTESDDYFYVTISRKVFIVDAVAQTTIIYLITAPCFFDDLDKLAETMEKFTSCFGNRIIIDNKQPNQ